MPNLEFRSVQTLGIGFLVMNTEKKPFNDTRVRMAISYAINKKELVRKYFLGGQTGIIANTFTPPQILRLYDESLNRDYNPEKAKSLLKEAGLPDGLETTLSIAPNPRPYLPDPPEIANDIKLQLEAVGIKAKIIPFVAPDGGGNPLQQGLYEISLSGWLADTIDPNDYFTALFSPDSINSSNITRWTNKKFNELIAEGRGKKDPASRLKFYQQIQVLLHQEMPFVPLIYPFKPLYGIRN